MADNTLPWRVDDVSGVGYPYVKIDLGGDGVSTPVIGYMPVGITAQTSGGTTPYKLISANTTNATSVKGSAGQIFTIYAHNVNAAVRYLKFYDKATAPTVGTDTPVLTFPIPGNTAGVGFVFPSVNGLSFSLGIALALTTGVADNDTGAVAANDIVVNFGYK